MYQENSINNTCTDTTSCEPSKEGPTSVTALSPSSSSSSETLIEKIEKIEIEPIITLEGHTERVWFVAWHPTLNILASASADTTVKLWALETDYTCKEGSNANVNAMTNENNEQDNTNNKFCTAGKEQKNKLCAESSTETAAVTLNDNKNEHHININNNNNKATSSLSLSTSTSPPPSTHCDNTNSETNEEATRFVNSEVKPMLRNTSNESQWRCVCTLSGEHTRTIRHVSWSPSGNYLACASFDHTVSVWQRVYDDGELSLSYEVEGILDGHESEVKCVAWGSDSILATCARDHNVWIWERVEEGEYECAGILTGHLQDIKHCLWEPQPDITSHQRVLSCGYDNTIKVWSDSSIRQEDWHCVQTMKRHTGTVWAAAFQKAASLQSDHNTSNTIEAKTNTNAENTTKCEEHVNTTPISLSVQDDNALEEQHTLTSPLLCTCSDDLSLLFWRRRVSDDKYEHVASYSGFCTRSIFAIDWSMHIPSLLAAVSGDNSITLLCAQEDKQLCEHVTNSHANTNTEINSANANNDISSGSGNDDNNEEDKTKLHTREVNLVHVNQLFHLDNAHDADVNSVSFANTMSSTRCKKDNNNWDNICAEQKQEAANYTSLLMATGGDDHKVKLWRVNVTNN